MHFFLYTKEKSAKKEVCQRAVEPPLPQASEHRRTVCRPRKFRPHLTQGFSVQMGCHRGIANSPNHRFFPTNCGGKNPISITRTARRAHFFFCRDRRPRLSALCVESPLRAQNSFHTVGRGLAPAKLRPLRYKSALSLVAISRIAR